jgi:hypothetical protein
MISILKFIKQIKKNPLKKRSSKHKIFIKIFSFKDKGKITNTVTTGISDGTEDTVDASKKFNSTQSTEENV